MPDEPVAEIAPLRAWKEFHEFSFDLDRVMLCREAEAK